MSRKKKAPKINLTELKKDLVDDLDQFLLNGENNLDQKKVAAKKKRALAELDKLIKEDLSYSQILTKAKQDIAEDTPLVIEPEPGPEKEEEYPVEEEPVGEASQSDHILDLRQPVEEIKAPKLAKYKDGWQQFKENLSDKYQEAQQNKQESKEAKQAIVKEKEPFDWSFGISFKPLKLKNAFAQTMVFTLIVAIILLPIRGLVFFGQVQEDKDKIWQFGRQGIVSLQSGVISASGNSFQAAQADFGQALDNFNQAQQALDNYQSWMLETASVVPIIGKPVSLSRNILQVATNISQAGTILNQELQEENNLTEYIQLIHQQTKDTLPYLEEANGDLANISTATLPKDLRPYLEDLKTYLPTIIEDLHNLDDIFSILLDLLGHDREQRYLVLFQNNNELRATGGFIGSFALLDVYQGKVIGLEVPKGGTYDLEAGQKTKYKSPKALSLINPHFNIWDANWWSDFPTSAKKITTYYQDATSSSVDGVIAINANVLQELLRVLGPVRMEEYGVTITADNIFDVVQEEVEFNYDKEANTPKAIIADLVPQVLEKLLSSNDKYKDIISTFANMLATKNIQLYTVDEELQTRLNDFGWSGKIAMTDSDYLQVVNTNIAGGKTDNDIYQTIDHQATIQANGEIINTVRVTRVNKGDADNPLAGIDGGNVSYLRFYVPLGSQFIEALGFDKIPDSFFNVADDGAELDEDILREENNKMIDGQSNMEIYSSLDKTVFANWVTLKPGESQTVSIKYKLPFKLDLGDPLVNNWWQNIFKDNLKLNNYSLVIQSQSGSSNTILNSSVLLPDNVRVVFNNASNKEQMSVAEKLVLYSNELSRDQYFGFILATE